MEAKWRRDSTPA